MTIDTSLGHRFLRSVAERDWDTLASCFAADATFHAIIGLLCSGFLPIDPPRPV